MNILIVESRAKCKTLLKHLGRDEWRVLPTGGHVERLAEDRDVHPPKEVKKAYWSHAAGELPQPPWFWTENGEEAIRAIREEGEKHDSVTIYLATDPDREGERIAWHLHKLLDGLGPRHRVTFQEITKSAVLRAVASPRDVDQSRVDAALVRTFIDRVVGWRASRIARRFSTTRSNSMGRVQTPTLGFVVERELAREAHVPIPYFEVTAATEPAEWHVVFHERDEQAAWVDEKGRFDRHRTGQLPLAESAHGALVQSGQLEVSDSRSTQTRQKPPAPFSTDALLQEAGSRWGWTPRKTSALASQLYEAGHVTYIRTDSTRLAAEAVKAGGDVIVASWGKDMRGPAKPPQAGAGAQDAHEAIRPTDLGLESVPDAEPDVQKLYALVRARTLASLMVPAVRTTRSLRARCEGLDLPLDASVGWYSEPGWRRAFEGAGIGEELETTPVSVKVGETFELLSGTAEAPNPELRKGETQPPARYRPHTVVRVMKDAGIGRPSTYASTVDRLVERGYVTADKAELVPTRSGRNIWMNAAPLYTLPDGSEVFSAEYTASMESVLDEVAEGGADASTAWERMLEEFKRAHEAAQEAVKAGGLTPRTRKRLKEYLDAAPSAAAEIGRLEDLTEEQGREWLQELQGRDIKLLMTDKQQKELERLLEETRLTLAQAVESAGMKLAGKAPNRDEASELIEHLRKLEAEERRPSDRQMKLISSLRERLGLSEAEACAMIDLGRCDELTGGKDGTASKLIDALQEALRQK